MSKVEQLGCEGDVFFICSLAALAARKVGRLAGLRQEKQDMALAQLTLQFASLKINETQHSINPPVSMEGKAAGRFQTPLPLQPQTLIPGLSSLSLSVSIRC